MSTITDLFPVPSPLLSKYVPAPWAGITPTSTKTLLRVLEDNHEKWHIFFNDLGYHNHVAHRAIALWALGADSTAIEQGYQIDSSYQMPAIDPPEIITASNWSDHLGKRSYYRSYLAFFTDLIRQNGVAATIEEYIFSKRANFENEDSGKPHPQMFDRFLGGLLHPMIHAGYGLEFGLPGMVAEGLAEAAVHPRNAAALIPASYFGVSTAKSAVPPGSNSTGIHAFTVISHVLSDLEIRKKADTEQLEMYSDAMKEYGHKLIKYVGDWHVNTKNPEGVARSLEELFWTNALIYGVGGWEKNQDFHADFFHMHLVTSSVFLPSYMAYLNSTSQEILLRGYLLASITWWVSRGRPGFDIKGFFESTSPYPTPTGPLPTPSEKALPSPSSPKAVTPNPWFSIIENALVHPGEHVIKLQRTLVHYASLFGTREAGLSDFKDTELPFAEILDGSLFIRVAGLTAAKMGRVREGEEASEWDRDPFYKN